MGRRQTAVADGRRQWRVRSFRAGGDHSVFATRPPLQRLALCYDDARCSLLSAKSPGGPWMDLEAVLEGFLAATADVRGEDPRLNELAPQLLQLSKRQPRATLDHTLRRLLSGVNARHPQVAGFVALMGGCLVEEGADPNVLVLRPRSNDR